MIIKCFSHVSNCGGFSSASFFARQQLVVKGHQKEQEFKLHRVIQGTGKKIYGIERQPASEIVMECSVARFEDALGFNSCIEKRENVELLCSQRPCASGCCVVHPIRPKFNITFNYDSFFFLLLLASLRRINYDSCVTHCLYVYSEFDF